MQSVQGRIELCFQSFTLCSTNGGISGGNFRLLWTREVSSQRRHQIFGSGAVALKISWAALAEGATDGRNFDDVMTTMSCGDGTDVPTWYDCRGTEVGKPNNSTQTKNKRCWMAYRLKLLFFSIFFFFVSTLKVQDSTLLNVSVCIYNRVRDWTLASHSHPSHMSVTKYKSCSGSTRSLRFLATRGSEASFSRWPQTGTWGSNTWCWWKRPLRRVFPVALMFG